MDVASKGAIKELIPPGLLTIMATPAVGFILGKQALGGYLAGIIFTGPVFALLMANGGGSSTTQRNTSKKNTTTE